MKILRKYKETCIGIGMALFTAFVYINTFSIKNTGLTGETIYAASVPRWVCFVLWALSVALVAQDLVIQGRNHDESSANKKNSGINLLTFSLTAVAITIYILIMKPVGFCPSSALFLFAEFNILSERKDRKTVLFAIIAIVTALAVYLIFKFGLSLLLPSGIMPF